MDAMWRTARIACSVILSAVVVGCSGGGGTLAQHKFASGEVLLNECRTNRSWDGSVQHNRLFFRENPTAKREFLAEITRNGAAPALDIHRDAKVVRDSKGLVVTFDRYMFKRHRRPKDNEWFQAVYPDPEARAFVEAFSKGASVNLGIAEGHDGELQNERGEPPLYRTETLDLESRVLVQRLKGSNSVLPQVLVYSANTYGLPWRFDLQRTRDANGIAGPTNVVLDFEVSVVTVPTSVSRPSLEPRAALLQRPGARETMKRRVVCTASEWTDVDVANPIGPDQRFQAILGFTRASKLYVFWNVPGWLATMYACNPDEWVAADESGYEGGVSRLVYFKVRPRVLDSSE